MTIMDKEDELLINKNVKQNKSFKQNKKPHPQKENLKKGKIKKGSVSYKIISGFLIILSFMVLYGLIKESSFSFFYLFPIILISSAIVFVIIAIMNKKHLRKWVKNIFALFAFAIIILEGIFLLFGTKTLKFLASITDAGYRVETFGVYVLNESSYTNLNALSHKRLSYLKHDDDKNINEALKKISKEIDFTKSSNSTASGLVNELINKKVDAILMDTSYEVLLQEEYPDNFKQIRQIQAIDIVDIVKTIKSNKDITKESFAIYISGIDTSGNVASKARSDVNMILAVNPQTKNIAIVNTPRDYYVMLPSKKKHDKLTHAGLYGIEESVNALSSLYDIDIDYYVRLNFTSFIKIIDELGGIKVNVPIEFCEQDSNRSKLKKDLICLKKGEQILKGEEALALARHRKSLASGDRARGENQMLVLESMLKTAMSFKSVTKYNSLIEALKGRVTTNMQPQEMLEFARKNLGSSNKFSISSYRALGSDSTGVCYASGNLRTYIMEPDIESLSHIKSELKNMLTASKNNNK